MIAIYNLPFPDFDYAGWANQCGLTVVQSTVRQPSNMREFIVRGDAVAIDRFSADLDFAPEVRAETLLGAMTKARTGMRP